MTELFRLLRLVSVTVYRSTSHPRSHCQSSTVALRHISSDAAFFIFGLLCSWYSRPLILRFCLAREIKGTQTLRVLQYTFAERTRCQQIARCDVSELKAMVNHASGKNPTQPSTSHQQSSARTSDWSTSYCDRGTWRCHPRRLGKSADHSSHILRQNIYKIQYNIWFISCESGALGGSGPCYFVNTIQFYFKTNRHTAVSVTNKVNMYVNKQ